MRIKAKVKNNMLKIKVRIHPSYDIQRHEVEIIRENSIRGLLRPKCHDRHGVEYVGPEGIPLKVFIKKKISKYVFFSMMYQIIEVIKKVKKLNLSVDNILFDLNYIYVNEKTKEMLYIYMPVKPRFTGLSITSFMEQVALQAEYEEDDIDYVAEYINYVNLLSPFDELAVEQYLATSEELVSKKIARNKYLESKHTCRKNVTANYADDETERMERKPERIKDISDNKGEETELLINTREQRVFHEISKEETSPRIISSNTNAIFCIEKRVFRIGKEKRYVDLFLDDETVSRKHADIVVREDRYYIYDHGSKNHTYVNGVRVLVGEEIEIRHGDRISFAKEEFVFYIE